MSNGGSNNGRQRPRTNPYEDQNIFNSDYPPESTDFVIANRTTSMAIAPTAEQMENISKLLLEIKKIKNDLDKGTKFHDRHLRDQLPQIGVVRPLVKENSVIPADPDTYIHNLIRSRDELKDMLMTGIHVYDPLRSPFKSSKLSRLLSRKPQNSQDSATLSGNVIAIEDAAIGSNTQPINLQPNDSPPLPTLRRPKRPRAPLCRETTFNNDSPDDNINSRNVRLHLHDYSSDEHEDDQNRGKRPLGHGARKRLNFDSTDQQQNNSRIPTTKTLSKMLQLRKRLNPLPSLPLLESLERKKTRAPSPQQPGPSTSRTADNYVRFNIASHSNNPRPISSLIMQNVMSDEDYETNSSLETPPVSPQTPPLLLASIIQTSARSSPNKSPSVVTTTSPPPSSSSAATAAAASPRSSPISPSLRDGPPDLERPSTPRNEGESPLFNILPNLSPKYSISTSDYEKESDSSTSDDYDKSSRSSFRSMSITPPRTSTPFSDLGSPLPSVELENIT